MQQPDLFGAAPARRRERRTPAHDVDGRFVSGKLLAERGKALALEHAGDWSERIVLEAGVWCADRKREGMRQTTIEQLRKDARNAPPTPQAWGALPRLLCRAGLIEPAKTADGHPLYTPAASLATHGHPVRVWVLL